MCFGVEDADVETLLKGVGGDVGHAEGGQGEVVDAGPDRGVTQWGIERRRCQLPGEVGAGDDELSLILGR